MAKVNIPTFKLNNGLEIPAVGYGTWLGLDDKSEFMSQDIPKLVDGLCYALESGYRHIDTAHLYRVEGEVGGVVRGKIEEGVIKREDVFITTKVWNHNHRPEAVESSVRQSLQRMGLSYVDCVLMHWPMAISEDGVDEKIDYLDTWRGFESVLEQGLARSVGVSNFNVEQLKRLLAHAEVKPVINQVEINLNLGQKELVEFCKEHNILVVGYTPLGSLARNVPDKPTSLDDPVLTGIASKHGKTVAQVVLRYLYQRGIATIPKSITKSRILQNASIFDFELDKDDVTRLEKFDCNYRTVRPTFWQNFENYPFDKVDGETPKLPLALLKW